MIVNNAGGGIAKPLEDGVRMMQFVMIVLLVEFFRYLQMRYLNRRGLYMAVR